MSSLDYLDLCRLCLVKDRVSVSIFDGEGEDRQIYLKIAACLPVKLGREDKLPKKICDDCLYKVELLYEFWNTTSNAEKQLWQWLGEVELEDKQGYIGSNINSALMKSEQGENRLNVVQASAEHQNMGLNMIDNMGLTMPIIMSPGQAISVPISSSETVQTVQSMAGPSSQARKDREDDEDSTEDDNTEDEIDHDEGLPVKEENEDTRIIEPTNFVNVASMACDEAGPSGLQQKLPEMTLQATDVDPKSGFQPPDLNAKSTDLSVTSATTRGQIKVENDLEPNDTSLAFHCKICSESFASQVLLDGHEAQHEQRKTCDDCGRVFRSCVNLRKHMRKHTERQAKVKKDTPDDLECKVCRKVFRHRSNFQKHLLRHTAGDLACKHCSKTFRLFRDLTRHEKTHFFPSYTCKECDYETTVLAALTIHMTKHTDKSDLPFQCDDCHKRFRKAVDLQEHYNIHSGDKPFICQQCGHAFCLRRQLSAHCRRLHPEVKAAKVTSTACDICGRVLATKRSLFRHKESHNPAKPYLCDFCGKSLSSAEHLKKHRRIHTGEKPYVCDVCGKPFTDSENLRMHRRIHTGEKPYKCDQCPKAFSQRSTLTIHRRGHTGERPYVCQICHRGFSCQGNLTAHQKSTCV